MSAHGPAVCDRLGSRSDLNLLNTQLPRFSARRLGRSSWPRKDLDLLNASLLASQLDLNPLDAHGLSRANDLNLLNPRSFPLLSCPMAPPRSDGEQRETTWSCSIPTPDET